MQEHIAIRHGHPVTVQHFLSQANGLAAALPESGFAINVCEDRYLFFLGFAAALLRGLTTLLPPNPLEEIVNGLARTYPSSFVLADDPGLHLAAPVFFPVPETNGPASNAMIPADARAVIAFTSGSTGASAPQEKSWQSLVRAAAINARHYLGETASPHAIVATVPPQHMYGLETTVMTPLCAPALAHDGRPFYPASVKAALQEVPAPRMLVSTPVHLRALVRSGVDFPRVERILSATAPLDRETAVALERLFGGGVVEIYGCTEAGSLAQRRTAITDRWRLFDGFRAHARDGGTWVAADHLGDSVRLPDILEFQADGSFLLVGRDSDVVKVAGKRGSLAEITRHLLEIPGVDDAAVFMAPGSAETARVAALVVSASLEADTIKIALRRQLDPAFIPRRIVMVPALPRSATGKLPRDALLRLYGDTVASAEPQD